MKSYEEIENELIAQLENSMKNTDPMKFARAFGEYFVSIDKLMQRSTGSIREVVSPFKAAALLKIADCIMETLDDDGKDVVKDNKDLLDHIIITVSSRGKAHHD